MASGIINGTTSNQYIDSKIEWSSSSNTSGNYSTVTASLYYRRNNTGYVTYGTGNFSLNIGGEVFSINSSRISINTDWVLALTAMANISHNNDGTKQITISASGSIPSTSLSSTTCSGTAMLDTIPRTSMPTLSATTFTIGNDVYLYTNRKASSFTHSVFIKRNDGLYYGAVLTNIGASVNLNTEAVRNVFYELCTASTSKKTEILLRTFNGSEEIGDNAIEFTVKTAETSETKPYITASVSPINSLSDAFNSLYIQGKTKAKVNLSGSHANSGATLTTFRSATSISWGTLAGIFGYYHTPYIEEISTDILATAGEQTVSAYIVDSRGYKSEWVHLPIYVHEYVNPKIIPLSSYASVICERCTADKVSNPAGTYLKIQAQRKYSPIIESEIQKNWCEFSYRVKSGEGTYSAWNTLLAKSNVSTDTVDVALENVVPSIATSYTVQLRVLDDLSGESNADILTFDIPTDKVTYHLKKGGRGIGIGKYSEIDDCLEIAPDWKIKIWGEEWQELGLSENVSESLENIGRVSGCRYIVLNDNHVYVAFNCAFSYNNAAVIVNDVSIPEIYRPIRTVYALCAVNGRAIAQVEINTDGNVSIGYIQSVPVTSDTTLYQVTWIDGYIDYWI